MAARRTGDKPPAPNGGLPLRIKIPGGEATFWKSEELPTYKEREISILGMQINKTKLRALSQARNVSIDGTEPVTAEQIQQGELAVLTDSEARALVRLTDVAIWAYLKGWTLTEMQKDVTADGNPITVRVPVPLPETPDDVKYLPKNLYTALENHANQLIANSQALNESFEGNPEIESPTTD